MPEFSPARRLSVDDTTIYFCQRDISGFKLLELQNKAFQETFFFAQVSRSLPTTGTQIVSGLIRYPLTGGLIVGNLVGNINFNSNPGRTDLER